MRRRVLSVALRGPVPYRSALEAQRRLAGARIEGAWGEDLLLLLEHEPVLTLGRGARGEEHVLASPEALEARGVERVEIERGGDVTYHGPGQLVGYPILDLRDHRRDLHWYVRRLEEALVRAVGELGLPAVRVAGHTGVWVADDGGAGGGLVRGEEAPGPVRTIEGDFAEASIASGRLRKLASIGVHVSRWVTWHGFALNVTREPLEAFGWIVPCGIRGARVTSLEAEGCAPEGGVAGEALRGAVERGMAAAFEVPVERARGERLAGLRRLVPALSFADGSAPAGRVAALSGSEGS